jgi:hypothetical protein
MYAIMHTLQSTPLQIRLDPTILSLRAASLARRMSIGTLVQVTLEFRSFLVLRKDNKSPCHKPFSV